MRFSQRIVIKVSVRASRGNDMTRVTSDGRISRSDGGLVISGAGSVAVECFSDFIFYVRLINNCWMNFRLF